VISSTLVDGTLAGERRAVARLISLIENDGEEARDALSALYPHTGRAHIIGVTGAPGTGKSTLVNRLALEYRARGVAVGIIAVDPTSPFSGGAILGDRIRMRDLSGDPGIFIRSMASRGRLGGLARTTGDVVRVLDAAGFETVIVETVGAGQAEVEIASTAYTTLVIDMPGLGDDIQAIKCGLMEIADILVVNKADRDGADNTVACLQMMLDLNANASHPAGYHSTDPPAASGSVTSGRHWRPPIIKTIATQGEGTAELLNAIEEHREFLHQTGLFENRERARARSEFMNVLRHDLVERLLTPAHTARIGATVDAIAARNTDPYTASETLVRDILGARRGET